MKANINVPHEVWQSCQLDVRYVNTTKEKSHAGHAWYVLVTVLMLLIDYYSLIRRRLVVAQCNGKFLFLLLSEKEKNCPSVFAANVKLKFCAHTFRDHLRGQWKNDHNANATTID